MSKLAHQFPDEKFAQNSADKAALLSIPQAHRAVVGKLWSFNADIHPSPIVLCARVVYWIAEFGLTAEELQEIADRLMEPARCATHKYPRDFLNDFSQEVANAAKRRQVAEEAAQREAERIKADAKTEAEKKALQAAIRGFTGSTEEEIQQLSRRRT